MHSQSTIAIVLLAAGRATRIGGGRQKLLAEFEGIPLARRMAQVAIDAKPHAVVIVTGCRQNEINAVVEDLEIIVVNNPLYATGIASSIVAGINAPPVTQADGTLIMLADMPAVTVSDLSRLINIFHRTNGQVIVRATCAGKAGNPVIIPKTLRERLLQMTGDIGARQIIQNCQIPIVDVDIGEAALTDVDTPRSRHGSRRCPPKLISYGSDIGIATLFFCGTERVDLLLLERISSTILPTGAWHLLLCNGMRELRDLNTEDERSY